MTVPGWATTQTLTKSAVFSGKITTFPLSLHSADGDFPPDALLEQFSSSCKKQKSTSGPRHAHVENSGWTENLILSFGSYNVYTQSLRATWSDSHACSSRTTWLFPSVGKLLLAWPSRIHHATIVCPHPEEALWYCSSLQPKAPISSTHDW